MSIKEKMTSGQGRAVAWDGVTQGGQDLKHQVKAIQDNRADLASSRPATMTPHNTAYAGGQAPGSLPPPPQRPTMTPATSAPPPARPPAPPAPLMPPPPMMRPPMPPPGMMGMPPGYMGMPPPGGPMGMQPRMMGPPPGMPPHMQPPPGMGMGPPPGMMGMPPPPGMGMGMQPPRPPMGMMGMAMHHQGGPMHGGGPPMPPGHGQGRDHPPLPPMEEPDAKRPRVSANPAAAASADFVLQAEEEFLELHAGPARVKVLVPEMEGSDKLVGQLLEVEVGSLADSVGDFKARLAGVLDVAAGKQVLSREGAGFLRNELSLAHYNVSPTVVLTLTLKERGGRKK